MKGHPFKNRVTEMLGIEYPIIQGGMQWLPGAELVAAVSNAGGLGTITSASFATVEELKKEIRRTKGLTDKPFAVNINLMPTMRPLNNEEYIALVLEEGVRIVETSGRSPEPYMEQLKRGGAILIHKVARLRDARTAERVGADMVTMVGFEAAGHPGMEDITSLVRLPIAVEALKIPVLAAGGIADGRGFLAALVLGAEGVVMGTRFLATHECSAHPRVKEWLLKAQETDTVLIERSIGNAIRVLRNDVALKVLEMEEKGATLEDLLPLISGLKAKRVFEEGDLNAGTMACGEVVGLIHEIKSAREVIEGIIQEATAILKRF